MVANQLVTTFRKLHNRDITLIEVIAVLTILGILVVIAIPSVRGLIENTKQEVCHVNILKIERMYETYVALESIEHSDAVFTQYLQEYGGNICGDDCDITHVNREVQCSEYCRDNDDEDESEPFI